MSLVGMVGVVIRSMAVAGMSGGMSFVYDVNKTFKKKVNMEMINFDPLERSDIAELKRLITNHFENTGSDVAETILNDWDNQLQHFVKVMPADYKRVMLKRQLKELENKKEEVVNG